MTKRRELNRRRFFIMDGHDLLCTQGRNSTTTAAHASGHTDARRADVSESENNLVWYVAYTKPRQEEVAETNLARQNFQTYLPLFKTLKKAVHDEPQLTLEPMFPRYIFFKPGTPKQSIAAARSTRGVNALVSFGSRLAVIQENGLEAIKLIEERRNQAGLQIVSPFQPGRRVRLRNSALNGAEGLVQAVSAKRVMLLMEILGRTKTIKVEHGQLELV